MFLKFDQNRDCEFMDPFISTCPLSALPLHIADLLLLLLFAQALEYVVEVPRRVYGEAHKHFPPESLLQLYV